MTRTVVINAVGLTRRIAQQMPSLRSFGRASTIGHVMPAVTCSVQATYLTGTLPREHGIVGNGWYFRDECVIRFWHQSDKLVQRPRIWEIASRRDPSFKTANLFWWNAMYSAADITATPRPMYPADGRKIPDIWTHPPRLRNELQTTFGQFPLFKFWGPAAAIESSEWIANAAIHVDRQSKPDLTLIYLPHLDYSLQKFGPDAPQITSEIQQLDNVLRMLLEYYQNEAGTRAIILSEYGIAPVHQPVHLNRVLNAHGLLTLRREIDGDLLDAGASAAFAVADHQVAHVYVNERSRLNEVEQLLRSTPGVAEVLSRDAQYAAGIDHPRSGDLLVVAAEGSWFTYYYWLEDSDQRPPGFARTVDIHRKPGYDPVELFIDPEISNPKARIGWTLMKRRMGFRTLLDVIPLDASLVKGSHGRAPADADAAPVWLEARRSGSGEDVIDPTSVCERILQAP
jgi:predicted AlkP superfamily pyrophosphatase or phosphodiesterase